MQKICRNLLPWLIGFLPVIGLFGVFLNYDSDDLSKASMFAGTIVGIFVATLTAFLTSRSSQLQILVEAQRHFFSDKTMPALKKLGPIWSEERRKILGGTWQLQDNVGFQYIQLIESDCALHNSRRELSGLLESLCVLVNEGIISHRLATSVFSDLEERAIWLTVVEEFLALKISAGRFTSGDCEQFIKSWNRSRCRIWPKYDNNIELGKPHLRRLSRLRLILDNTKNSRCDYADHELRIHPNEILLTDAHQPQEPIKLKLVNQES